MDCFPLRFCKKQKKTVSCFVAVLIVFIGGNTIYHFTNSNGNHQCGGDIFSENLIGTNKSYDQSFDIKIESAAAVEDGNLSTNLILSSNISDLYVLLEISKRRYELLSLWSKHGTLITRLTEEESYRLVHYLESCRHYQLCSRENLTELFINWSKVVKCYSFLYVDEFKICLNKNQAISFVLYCQENIKTNCVIAFTRDVSYLLAHLFFLYG